MGFQMKNLSVSAKISLGFAIVLALHVSLAVLSHYGLIKAGNELQKQQQLSQRVEVFHKIDRTVSELERNVLLFAAGGYEGPKFRAKELQTQLNQILDSVEPFDQDGDLQSVKAMKEHLKTHCEIFDAMITDRAKRRDLVENEMQKTGSDFSEYLDQVRLAHPELAEKLKTAEEAFLSARMLGLKYVHSPDSRHAIQIKDELAVARNVLEELHETERRRRKQLSDLAVLIDKYERNHIQMVQATRGYLHLVNVVMAGESQELIYQAKNARRAYTERANELYHSMVDDSASFSFASNVFSLLTILLGVVASWSIKRSISPPLNAITTTFDRLARGENCPTIPGSSRQDELGRLAAAAQVFRDKAAQTEELLQEVNRMRELERSQAHSQKMQSLGQLASGLAHEINTPLQCVAANVEFLEESQQTLFEVIDACQEVLSGDQEASVELIDDLQEKLDSRAFMLAKQEAPSAAHDAADAVRRVVDIISAMKNFSHPDTSRNVSTDINQLIDAAAKLSRNQWKDCAELELDLATDLPMIAVQPGEISQVLINLLVNAGDAIEDCRLENELGLIRVGTRCTEDSVVIEVADNGGGISDEIQSRIFDPFFTTKDVGKGTGQGLSLVYDVVVRHHDGNIDVETDEYGTKFILTLPLTKVPIMEGC